ncbi:hypothetical protein F5X96DRAFT_29944 [Biscogniauxia mediterranea]|nr:hypothetical protein F5X96DRAFT_29944 [Biscogniauxia mediterranea]
MWFYPLYMFLAHNCWYSLIFHVTWSSDDLRRMLRGGGEVKEGNMREGEKKRAMGLQLLYEWAVFASFFFIVSLLSLLRFHARLVAPRPLSNGKGQFLLFAHLRTFFNKAYFRGNLKCVLLVTCKFRIRGQGGFSNSTGVFFPKGEFGQLKFQGKGLFVFFSCLFSCFVFPGLSLTHLFKKLTGRGGFLGKANSNKKFKRRRRRFSYFIFYSLPFKFPPRPGEPRKEKKEENPTSLTKEHHRSSI